VFWLQLRHALAIHKQVEHRLSTDVLDSFLVRCHRQVMSVHLQQNITVIVITTVRSDKSTKKAEHSVYARYTKNYHYKKTASLIKSF